MKSGISVAECDIRIIAEAMLSLVAGHGGNPKKILKEAIFFRRNHAQDAALAEGFGYRYYES